ncbi:universal stress protein UspA [Mesorhizobium sanjuanii]|uniref:Universal stress protein UspA n=2 Tax=Mesorhizobium sanjuanii TaxID=2037900 RepID=A0A2A6FMQ5_9HYPH|nr:universal stress protein UspA [Mesorhizobium sanjuanii]
MLRQAAEKTGDMVGDGTSTSTILAHAMFGDGVRPKGMSDWEAEGGTADGYKRALTNWPDMPVLMRIKAQARTSGDAATNPNGGMKMIFNTIMVQLDVDSPAAPRTIYAQTLARRFEAALIGFAAADPYVFIPGNDGGAAAAEIMRQRRTEIEDRLKIVKEQFLSLAGDDASWREEIGDPTRLLAMHARAADLIVTGSSANGADHHRRVDTGTLILSVGRPVLLAADKLAPLNPKNVLLAWKDTREARRAVSDAMPFLTGAQHVLVATIEEQNQRSARESIGDVVRFLMRHGVKARSEVLGAGHADACEAVTELARAMDAELVVAGGYGHSRLREWAFGGMTRSLLKQGSVNRLFSN